MGRGGSVAPLAAVWRDNHDAIEAARLAELDRERLRKERVPDAWWTAREAIERARRERAGVVHHPGGSEATRG